MTSNIHETGLTPGERTAMITEWLVWTGNSFLKKIEKESERETYYFFFVTLASYMLTHQVAFAKDFVKTYHNAVDYFADYYSDLYDKTLYGIIHTSIFGVVDGLLENKIIPGWSAKEIKQCEAARRIESVAKNN